MEEEFICNGSYYINNTQRPAINYFIVKFKNFKLITEYNS